MASGDTPIRITIIIGSVRPGNYTARAAALVADELGRREDVHVEVLDPAGMTLPLPGAEGPDSDAARLRESVTAATGIVFATPEYHGSFSSVTKLVIDNLGFPSVLAGKPIALLGVAAGQIGAIKAMEHLRSVLSHVGAVVLPGPVSVAGVREMFDHSGQCTDPGVEKRIRGVSDRLLNYVDRHGCPGLALEDMARAPGDR